MIFQGAVLILLLIACANVAGLLLAQANARQKELTVRSALGSTRNRVMRQLLAESLSLSVLGGVAGAALGWAGVKIFATFASSVLPANVEVKMDLLVVVFALGLSLTTGVIFGVLPAIQISRGDLMGALRESSRNVTASAVRHRLGSAFVVVQVALALVLLIGAGLLTNSLLQLSMVRPGFEPHGLLTFQVPFSRSLYRNVGGNTPTGGLQVEMTPRFNVLTHDVLDHLKNTPGIESASFAMTAPLGGIPRRIAFRKDAQVLDTAQQDAQSAEWYPIGSSYFHTLKIPISRGREFSLQDSANSAPVVVINEAMAKQYFPGEDPIGKRIQTTVLYDVPREIVGVVGNVRQDRYQYNPTAQMYVPYPQIPAKQDMSLSLDLLVATYILRTSENPANLISTLRKTVAAVDKSQAVTNMVSIEQYAAGQLQDLRHYAILLSTFGGISTLLSFIGLFGVMANAVSQRTNEIGIRVALGATSKAVLALVGRQGFTLVAMGMALGVGVSLALTRVLGRFLWGVSARDPITFGVVLLTMAVVALMACYVPARKAMRIDPIIALRLE
jgi:putative ABC transport system permease protein